MDLKKSKLLYLGTPVMSCIEIEGAVFKVRSNHRLRKSLKYVSKLNSLSAEKTRSQFAINFYDYMGY